MGVADRVFHSKNASACSPSLTRGVIGRPRREKSALLAKHGARSAPEQKFSANQLFFFALLAGYYCTLLYRDTRPLLASPPPPYAAAAARCRRTPPSSPLPHPPPPPLPQHTTAVTPESFADIVRVCCTPPHARPFTRPSARRCRLRCRPFAYCAAVIH
jgi:hypothetical protein